MLEPLVELDDVRPIEALAVIYKDYVNHYITHEKFAQDYGISVDAASELIDLSRRAFDDATEINNNLRVRG